MLKISEREKILDDLKCDELCYVKDKKGLGEKAKEKLHDNECPPCDQGEENE